jgi:hypothetical protein
MEKHDKEIVILEAFAGLLRGRQIKHDGAEKILLPMPRPLGYSMFAEETLLEDFPTIQVGEFEWQGKTDEEGLRIFQLTKVY